jgi:ABC-type nitrate/sulfonate/bicarbonate transport system substrate-binding protein
VGAQTGTVTHGALVNRLLPKVGLAAGDLQIINIRFQDMIGALEAGSVEAVTAVDPFMSAAEQGKIGRVLTDFCPFSRVPLVLATSDAVLKARGDEVAAFLRGWMDAARVFEARPAQAAELYGRSLKARGYELPAEVVAQIVRRLHVRPDTSVLSPPFMEFTKEEAELMQRAGRLPRIPDWARALRPDLIGR